ncbi:hypothetical protein Pmani_035838 [Petrolisthes manimaculis]|uniref:Major facilitator superfamily (MFS) profile domain-containing protein n=1 Tax=Petrolisthes manimaculis TaxID=1843537 RepID=A0AAE1NKW1_9EUCA|nr:hypothetical protein Pmani_035838 [Petrolisthes manimaculis]
MGLGRSDGFFLCFFTVDGITYNTGLLNPYLMTEFSATQSEVSWVNSLLTGFYLLLGPLTAALSNAYGFRSVCIAGSIMAGSAFILSSFSPNIIFLYFTYGVVGGTGFGFIYMSSMFAPSMYFKKWRSLAMGIAMSGCGSGMLVVAVLNTFLLEFLAWRKTLIVNAVVNIVISMFDMSLFRSPSFCVLNLASFLSLLAFYVPFMFLPSYGASKEIDTKLIALVMSGIGGVDTISRILMGWLADRRWMDHTHLLIICTVFGGVATMLIPVIPTHIPHLLFMYSIGYGASVGGTASLFHVVLLNVTGPEHLTRGFGIYIFFQGLASLLGTPAAGALSDLTGSFSATFYTFGAIYTLSGLLLLPLNRL